MRDALSAILRTLDALEAPLEFFLRDDDAGWDDARLLALLDTVGRCAVPIDLAAIPLAVGEPLAAELRARIDAAPAPIGVHQHGCAHHNHEPQGRACEFGPARDAAAQARDLLYGRAALRGHFGHRLQCFFTPPWNRCTSATTTLLAELGFSALSRDRGAKEWSALPELPVDVDWSRQHRLGGVPAVARALCDAIRARQRDGQPLGLMLHHAAMGAQEMAALAQLLAPWARHPRARWRPMAALLAARRGLALPATGTTS